MATSYTSLLGLALPVTGELSGTWGDTVNNYISTYIDAAVAGAQTVTTDTTLTKTTGTSLGSTSSQYAIIIASPAVANITITAPAASKIYTIINTSATYTVKIVGSGPTTGVTLGVSEKAQVAWNGSDFVRIGASGGPGVFSSITNTGLTAGRVVFSSTGGLEADSANLVWDNTNAYLGIGTSSPAVYTANSKLLQIDGGANAAEFKMTNSTTGSTGADGTLFQLNGSAFYLWNLENSFLSFGTNNTERMRLDSSGNLGLGVTPSTWSFGGNFDLNNDTNIFAGNVGFGLGLNAYYNSGWKYKGTGQASFLKQTGGEFRFYNAPSGANAGDPITFTQAMTLDASGRLGIGLSSPTKKLQVQGDVAIGTLGVSGSYAVTYNPDTAGNAVFWTKSDSYFAFGTGANPYSGGVEMMRLTATGNLGLGVTPSAWNSSFKALQVSNSVLYNNGVADTYLGANFYNDTGGTNRYITSSYAAAYGQQDGAHQWFTAPSGTAGNAITFTTAMTLDTSGNLLVGTTSGAERLCVIGTTNNFAIKCNAADTSGTYYQISFLAGASLVGSIISTTSATAYNTSSDYRLKNSIEPMQNALDKVAALKPVTYKWNIDGSDGEGFIAHELAEVCPHAVTGEKDAVNEDGSIKPQGIDTSFLVATLTAALQEAHSLIKDLQTRVAQLEAK